MLSIARSRLVLPVQLLFLAVNAFALMLGVVHARATPDLYANDSHGKTGWAMTWIAAAWLVLTWIQRAYAGRHHEDEDDEEDPRDVMRRPMNATSMAAYQRVHEQRFSGDSGQGTERNSASLCSHSRGSSVEVAGQRFASPGPDHGHTDLEDVHGEPEKLPFLRRTWVDRLVSRNVALFVGRRTRRAARVLHVVMERGILLGGLVAMANGTVVYGGIGRGDGVFNVLAHYIKGGIFFLYGLLTLGRWMGAFADLGWAWNVKPARGFMGHGHWTIPSAEFTESFVIWLYGVTNVFLEHLAAWGGAWTAQDLEHVSISVMFFGGGLLGMMIESRKMRDLLNYAVVSSSEAHPADESWQPPRHYPFSMNPMPALIIMLLGAMMSAHHQDSMLSTMLHGQWGGLFMGFALARGLTYLILYMAPPASFLPSRPPTEVIASFCLISGGITLIVSNKDTVAVLEAYHLDGMFTLTLTMGLTALLMAWTIVVVAIKGWAVQREHGRWHPTCTWYATCQTGAMT